MGDDGRPVDITCESCYLVMNWWWDSETMLIVQCTRCDITWTCVRATDPPALPDGTPLFIIYG